MATDSWNGNSDNWTTAKDWSTGAPPAAADTADIEAGNPQITSNVGTVGSVYMNSTTLSIESGTLNVAGGVTDLSGNLNVDDKSSSYTGGTFIPAAGGSNLSIGGTLTNSGGLNIGNVNLSAATTVSVGAISNLGSISVTGAAPGGTNTPQASLLVAGAAGFGTAGTVSNSVTLEYNAALQFGSGGFTTIASGGSLSLDGSQANVGIAGSNVHNSALSGLSEVDGSLTLNANSLTSSASNFINKGQINLDNFYSTSTPVTSSNLSLAGALNNSGTIGISGGNLNIAGTLTNSGYVSISGGVISASALNNSPNNVNYASINFSSSQTAASVLTLNGGNSSISGTVTGTGNLDFEGGTAVVNSGATLKSSNVTLGGNAHVEIAASAANVTSPFSFTNNAQATLQLDASVLPASGGTLSDTIVRIGAGDTVDLRSLAFASGATATYNASNNTLAVTSNGVTDTLSLVLPQATTFQAVSDGNGGTNVVVCFTTGTLIRTARGDVPVEDLRVGDQAVTVSDAHRPITWIGQRTMIPAMHSVASDIWPVRIRAGAFGDGLPERDLRLSPGHPVLVGADDDGLGGYLVPVMCLVNGTTIARAPVDSVTYWHVELDRHDILLAEGLPAESFLDYGNRSWFADGDALLDPDHVAPGLSGRCRPVAVDGPLVEAERRRLDALFATSLAAACAWPSVDEGASAPLF